MKTIVVFSGTTEGRKIAQDIVNSGNICHCMVATEYGKELAGDLKGGIVHTGRLNEAEMNAFFHSIKPDVIIDATHPYAKEVSFNIKNAARTAGIKHIRLLREESETVPSDIVVKYVDSIEAAAEYINSRQGRIFASTGSKEIGKLLAGLSDKSRVVVRILPSSESLDLCEKAGIKSEQIIAMQGPFSKEMNLAMFKEKNIQILVTKDGGKNGGFMEKLLAAKELGAEAVIIKRPNEAGCSYDTVLKMLSLENAGSNNAESYNATSYYAGSDNAGKKVFMVGCGMCDSKTLTKEAAEAIDEADIIIGAKRMIEFAKSIAGSRKNVRFISTYKTDEILTYLKNSDYETAAVVFSGDTGFFSGARLLMNALSEDSTNFVVNILPGISSVQAIAAHFKISWQDSEIASMHGTDTSLLSIIRKNRKTFAVFSDASEIRELAAAIAESQSKNANIRFLIGRNIGSDDEAIYDEAAEYFTDFNENGLFAGFFINETPDSMVTYGLEDAAFLREKVPMTKEEIRAVSISKLQLAADSIVYDIGAGTGSVTVECARLCSKGRVFAVEAKDDAVSLVQKNCSHFMLDNVTVEKGMAPEALDKLPAPTHVFIGGSKGNAEEIIKAVLVKNPKARVVLNAVTLETEADILNSLKNIGIDDYEVVRINISKSEKVGTYNLMKSLNPVTIVSFGG